MTANIDRAFVYNDLAGLNSLKAQSRTDEDAALKQVAKQFESMFINMMMTSMRQANDVLGKDSMFNSQETDFYEEEIHFDLNRRTKILPIEIRTFGLKIN